MTLEFEEEGDVLLDIDCEAVARTVIDKALSMEGCPYEACVSLLLTDNEVIHQMNLEFRHMDCPTDVLSFPMVYYPAPADFSQLEEEHWSFHPETGELVLGDIVISKEKVIEQAREYGHSVLREYAFLIAHSMLHLMGYDHMKEEEREVMEQKQRDILEALSISR